MAFVSTDGLLLSLTSSNNLNVFYRNQSSGRSKILVENIDITTNGASASDHKKATALCAGRTKHRKKYTILRFINIQGLPKMCIKSS
jgi:hypothetical protein